MKNFNICIDIDGTITDPYYWLDICNKYFKKNVSIEQVTEYDITKVLKISEEEFLEFYDKYKFILHDEEEIIREDAKRVINNIVKDNNIFFVTARDASLEMLTLKYLKKHDIKYDDIFLLGTHYKVNIAKKLNCDIFIEDNHQNAIQLSENGIKVILIDTNYNRLPINSNIIRVNNWEEIHEIIKNIHMEENVI